VNKTPKRPRDLNQWAKRMVDIVSGEIVEKEPSPKEERARKAGWKGGPATDNSSNGLWRDEVRGQQVR
jgi:hypothetical protein